VNAEVVQPYAQALSVARSNNLTEQGEDAFLTETTAKFRGAAQFSGKPILSRLKTKAVLGQLVGETLTYMRKCCW